MPKSEAFPREKCACNSDFVVSRSVPFTSARHSSSLVHGCHFENGFWFSLFPLHTRPLRLRSKHFDCAFPLDPVEDHYALLKSTCKTSPAMTTACCGRACPCPKFPRLAYTCLRIERVPQSVAAIILGVRIWGLSFEVNASSKAAIESGLELLHFFSDASELVVHTAYVAIDFRNRASKEFLDFSQR